MTGVQTCALPIYLAERASGSDNLVTTGAATSLANTDLGNFSTGTTYTITYDITRTATGNDLLMTIGGLGSISASDNTPVTSFDTVLVSFHGTGADSATLDNVNVSVIPEPSILLLTALAGLVGLVALRRR